MHRLLLIFSLLATCCLPSALRAQRPRGFWHSQPYGRFGMNLPVAHLPPQVQAPEGKLSLFADFNARNAEGVPVYVVNRAAATVYFPADSFDIYLRLQRQLSDGQWERAQPYEGSDCGNSFYPVQLDSNQYFVAICYLPTQGVKARVRFASYRGAGLISNAGDGFVLEEDVAAARVDELSWNAPSPLAHLLDQVDAPEDSRSRNPPTLERMVAAVRLLQAYGGNLIYQLAAARLAQKWEKPPTSAQEIWSAQAIRQVLAKPWTAESDLPTLLKRCVAALNFPQPNLADPGTPEQEISLVWEVLVDVAKREFSGQLMSYRLPVPDPQPWRPVMDVAMSETASDIPLVREAAVQLIDIPALADAWVPDRFFEDRLFEKDARIRWDYVSALARRKHRQKLVEIGRRLPPEDQVRMLRIVLYAPYVRPDAAPGSTSPEPSASTAEEDAFWDHCFQIAGESPPKAQLDLLQTLTCPDYLLPRRRPTSVEEEKFWDHCFQTMPEESIRCLYGRSIDSPKNVFRSRAVHDALRDYLARQADQSDHAAKDFALDTQTKAAVETMADWQSAEDIPLFQKLLAYQGYEYVTVWREDPKNPKKSTYYSVHRYVIRSAAKEALLKLGMAVADDLQTEKEE